MAEVEQRRIAHIAALSGTQITDLIKSKAKAAEWALPIDYVIPDSDTEELDKGTAHITLDRVGLLTTTHLVPQNMLPSKIDSVFDGTMVVTGSGSTEKWTFTYVDSGTTHICVCPKPTASGEELPVLEYIYRDSKTVNGKTIYTQYRYVPDESTVGTQDERGQFVPIPSDLILADGAGTVVNDDDGAYTRQIDINIGTVDTATGNTVLEIKAQGGKNKLVHTTSGVTGGSYPVSQSTTPAFGSSPFSVPKITVNSTGHVTAVTDDNTTKITIPATPARAGTAGLIKIGTNNDVQSIAASNSIGTIPQSASDYVLVAAANHTHSAATLTLTHTNDSDKTYNGTAAISYDFNNFLKVTLPSSGPSAEGKVLAIVNSNGLKASWESITTLVKPSYAFVPASVSAVGTSDTTITLGTSGYTKSDDLGVSSTQISGLITGKVYAVSFALPMTPASAGEYLDEITFKVTQANTEQASCLHMVNEAITGVANHFNGTIFFKSTASTCKFTIAKTRSAGPAWSITGGTIQLAEVK